MLVHTSIICRTPKKNKKTEFHHRSTLAVCGLRCRSCWHFQYRQKCRPCEDRLKYVTRTAFSMRFGAVTGTRLTGVHRHTWEPYGVCRRNFFYIWRVTYSNTIFLISLRKTRNNTGDVLSISATFYTARATIEFRSALTASSQCPRRSYFGKNRVRVDNVRTT